MEPKAVEIFMATGEWCGSGDSAPTYTPSPESPDHLMACVSAACEVGQDWSSTAGKARLFRRARRSGLMIFKEKPRLMTMAMLISHFSLQVLKADLKAFGA